MRCLYAQGLPAAAWGSDTGRSTVDQAMLKGTKPKRRRDDLPRGDYKIIKGYDAETGEAIVGDAELADAPAEERAEVDPAAAPAPEPAGDGPDV